MSKRKDKWIGMTDKGRKWFEVKANKYGLHNTKEPIGQYALISPNNIPGREIHINDTIYREHIQECIWNYGPMFFTDIEIIKNNKIVGYVYSWKDVYKPDNGAYIDYENGAYHF